MNLGKQRHAQSRLSDSAADRERKLSVKQRPVERQRRALLVTGYFKLTAQRLRIYADSHRGKLKRALHRRIPYHYIAVEAPIVVVRRASVVRLARARQRPADLHDKDGPVLAAHLVLALLRRKLGIPLLKLRRRDGVHLASDHVGQRGIYRFKLRLRIAHRTDDLPDDIEKEFAAALLRGNDALPIPLININRMEIVKLLVAAECVHVAVKTAVGGKSVFCKRVALPLCKRMNDLDRGSRGRNVKRHRALHAVQVVVEPAFGTHEHRRAYSPEIQRRRKIFFKYTLCIRNCRLRLHDGEDRLVILGNERHFVTVPFSVIFFVASVSRSDKARVSIAPRQNAALLPSDHASL